MGSAKRDLREETGLHCSSVYALYSNLCKAEGGEVTSTSVPSWGPYHGGGEVEG